MGECGLLQVWRLDECENGSESYSASAGGHFGRRMYPSCRPVRLSPGATSAHPVRSRRGGARRSAVDPENGVMTGMDAIEQELVDLVINIPFELSSREGRPVTSRRTHATRITFRLQPRGRPRDKPGELNGAPGIPFEGG